VALPRENEVAFVELDALADMARVPMLRDEPPIVREGLPIEREAPPRLLREYPIEE